MMTAFCLHSDTVSLYTRVFLKYSELMSSELGKLAFLIQTFISTLIIEITDDERGDYKGLYILT